MPQRDMVAGEHLLMSVHSIMIRIQLARGRTSPETRVSFLLSSSTEFSTSIQSEVTSPSKTIHWSFSPDPLLI